MNWFDGSIVEAVNLSKHKNAIFVVFIEGDNDLSTEMAQTLKETEVLKRLSDEANFLAVKLRSGSPNYTYFAQIYQFVPVPSLFFIGRNGTPLEVVCAGIQPQSLASRIDKMIEEHHKDEKAKPSTSGHNLRNQTQNLIESEVASTSSSVRPPANTEKKAEVQEQPESSAGPTAPKVPRTEHHEITRSGREYDVICDGDVCVRKPKIRTDDDPGTSQRDQIPVDEPSTEQLVQEAAPPESTESMEEKLDRAKELIEARRREKAEKEKELEKQKELERRATGQGVAELRKWQAEQELKQITEDRKREKLENSKAKQRILDQIAQDRAEQRARDIMQPARDVQPAPTPQSRATATITSGDGTGHARIQFKMPDGTSHSATFDADEPLHTVRRYVADNLQVPANNFSLWTAFPRRELVEADSSLRSLQLVPSAAVLVLARQGALPVEKSFTITSIISFLSQLIASLILEPSQSVWNWIRSRLFPPNPRPEPTRPRSESPQRPVPPGVRYRNRTNVHRLADDRATDDDNNTWNGNSTQQM